MVQVEAVLTAPCREVVRLPTAAAVSAPLAEKAVRGRAVRVKPDVKEGALLPLPSLVPPLCSRRMRKLWLPEATVSTEKSGPPGEQMPPPSTGPATATMDTPVAEAAPLHCVPLYSPLMVSVGARRIKLLPAGLVGVESAGEHTPMGT